jgi:nucleoside-diphosphate-sugar epimerase
LRRHRRPGKLRGAEATIFRLTETYDNLVLDYIVSHPEAWYINLSSGAVYGTNFARPAEQSTRAGIDVNNIFPSDYYGIAKLHAESKHRAFPNRNIVDLRVFSYFSCFTDPHAKFLINEILSCVKQGKTFETGPDNIIRDYVHRDDLLGLIEACIAQNALNDVFDVYSLNPVAKFEMLDYLSKNLGLKYRVRNDCKPVSITGIKTHYYSLNHRASALGYQPKFTSMDCIREESKAILSSR